MTQRRALSFAKAAKVPKKKQKKRVLAIFSAMYRSSYFYEQYCHHVIFAVVLVTIFVQSRLSSMLLIALFSAFVASSAFPSRLSSRLVRCFFLPGAGFTLFAPAAGRTLPCWRLCAAQFSRVVESAFVLAHTSDSGPQE
jgi:hypothetical protein